MRLSVPDEPPVRKQWGGCDSLIHRPEPDNAPRSPIALRISQSRRLPWSQCAEGLPETLGDCADISAGGGLRLGAGPLRGPNATMFRDYSQQPARVGNADGGVVGRRKGQSFWPRPCKMAVASRPNCGSFANRSTTFRPAPASILADAVHRPQEIDPCLSEGFVIEDREQVLVMSADGASA